MIIIIIIIIIITGRQSRTDMRKPSTGLAGRETHTELDQGPVERCLEKLLRFAMKQQQAQDDRDKDSL